MRDPRISRGADETAAAPYVFDRSEADHERLVRQARFIEDFAREACLRAGLKSGQSAIDVGCGPLGALAVLAGLVGPTGTVIGLDADAAALAKARQVLEYQGVHAVRLVEADINTLSPAILTPVGPVDLAFARVLLMYQVDPAATLRKIARLVRSGGRIVAIDPLHDRHYSCFDPPVQANERILQLFFDLVEHRRGTVEVARDYRGVCERAGVHLVAQRGWIPVAQDPRDYVALYRDILLSMRGTLVSQGLSSEEEIEVLVREMDSAMGLPLRFGSITPLVEMIAEVP
jgi:ubiquinone/menaquinone biosynthesis C-methylase UbiE